jgi:polar amino acid transport system permease protein
MIRPFGYAEFLFLLESARWTILLSAIAFAGGGAGGLLVALCRISPVAAHRVPARVFIRVIQGTPLLMQLFLIFFGLGAFFPRLDPLFAAAAGLGMYASAFLGEIWRGSIQAVPAGQAEAADSLGLSYLDRMRFVVLPQAARMSYAPTVGFLVQLVKATSQAAIIGFTEMTRAAQIVQNATYSPFLTFGIVAAIYFLLCWPLTLLSARLERRSSANPRTRASGALRPTLEVTT